MFEKNLRLAYLLDFYGDVLDDHSGSVMRSYYEDDLSLSEIAAGLGISRQGVRHIIKRAEEQLEFLESKLGLAEQFKNIEDAAEELKKIANELSESEDLDLQSKARAILRATEKIESKDI